MSRSNEDFKVVTYKRSKKNRNATPSINPTKFDISASYNDTLVRRILEAKVEISSSDFFHSALASLREALTTLRNPSVKEIICFGLGKVGECMISRYQFAFLLCLKELYQIEVFVQDPVFTENDFWVFQNFQCDVIQENIEGKYKVKDNQTTIFYLPHCPKQLSNNLLWANWGLNLSECIIIANSFHTILDNTPKRILSKNAPYILNIVPHVLELAVFNTFSFYEIFNDTAIHIFPRDRISFISGDFWDFCTEPHYSDDDIEFIRNPKSAV